MKVEGENSIPQGYCVRLQLNDADINEITQTLKNNIYAKVGVVDFNKSINRNNISDKNTKQIKNILDRELGFEVNVATRSGYFYISRKSR